MPNNLEELTVYIDLAMTRRRRAHEVCNASGAAIFHAQTVGDLLAWLHENDHHEFNVIDGDARYHITLSPLPPAP